MNNQANFNWLSAAWRSQVTISEQRTHFGLLQSAFPLRNQVLRTDYGRPTHDDPDYKYCREEYDNYVEIHDWVCRMLEYIEEGEEEYLALDIEERYGVEIRISKGMTTKKIAEAVYYAIKSGNKTKKEEILEWLIGSHYMTEDSLVSELIGEGDEEYEHLVNAIEKKFNIGVGFKAVRKTITFQELADLIYDAITGLKESDDIDF